MDNPLECPVISDDIDEEEVWLYWIDSNKEPHGKAIRHLAQEAKEGTKADLEVLTYYRWKPAYSNGRKCKLHAVLIQLIS